VAILNCVSDITSLCHEKYFHSKSLEGIIGFIKLWCSILREKMFYVHVCYKDLPSNGQTILKEPALIPIVGIFSNTKREE
jgi:hypothetical protein